LLWRSRLYSAPRASSAPSTDHKVASSLSVAS
jgi:hypothetical protein